MVCCTCELWDDRGEVNAVAYTRIQLVRIELNFQDVIDEEVDTIQNYIPHTKRVCQINSDVLLAFRNTIVYRRYVNCNRRFIGRNGNSIHREWNAIANSGSVVNSICCSSTDPIGNLCGLIIDNLTSKGNCTIAASL